YRFTCGAGGSSKEEVVESVILSLGLKFIDDIFGSEIDVNFGGDEASAQISPHALSAKFLLCSLVLARQLCLSPLFLPLAQDIRNGRSNTGDFRILTRRFAT